MVQGCWLHAVCQVHRMSICGVSCDVVESGGSSAGTGEGGFECRLGFADLEEVV